MISRLYSPCGKYVLQNDSGCLWYDEIVLFARTRSVLEFQDDDPDAPRCFFHVTHVSECRSTVTRDTPTRVKASRNPRIIPATSEGRNPPNVYALRISDDTRRARKERRVQLSLCPLQHPLSFDRLSLSPFTFLYSKLDDHPCSRDEQLPPSAINTFFLHPLCREAND